MTVGLVESLLHRILGFNPCVAVHELRMRMRGARPFIVVFFYALIAAAAMIITLAVVGWERRAMYGLMADESSMGRTALTVLAYTQLTLILLILPAYAAGAITMEREKRTLEMLRATLLSPWDVVTGKLLVVVAFGGILLLTSLPVAAWCMLLGGVSPEEVFYVFTYLFVVAGWVSALGLLLSSLLRRSIGAIVGTYGTLIALGLGSYIMLVIFMMVLVRSGGGPPPFGDGGAIAIVGTYALVVGWLLFVALRWLWRSSSRWGRPGIPVAAIATIAMLLAFAVGAIVAYEGVRGASVTWLVTVNPYAGLSGVLDETAGGMLIAGFSGGSLTPG